MKKGVGSLPDFVGADEESAVDEVRVTEVVLAAMSVMCPTFLRKAEIKPKLNQYNLKSLISNYALLK